MKIKRRWKVLSILPMVFIIIGIAIGPGIYEHGMSEFSGTLLLFLGYVIGCVTGIVLYHIGIETEEREKKEWKYQDDVYEHYINVMSPIDHDNREDEAVNKTAIHFDTSPSAVRNIVRIYKDD